MAGIFLVLFIVSAALALVMTLWADALYRREGRDVAKAKKTAAEQIKDAHAKARAARIAEEAAEANATQADTRSLQLAAELAELRQSHAAEAERLRGVAAAAADDAALARRDAETTRQDAEMKARARGQAEAVWAAQKAEAFSALGRAEETLKRSLEAVQDARELVAGPVSPEAARIPGSKGTL